MTLTLEQIAGCFPFHGLFVATAIVTTIYENTCCERRHLSKQLQLTWLQGLFCFLCLVSACISAVLFGDRIHPSTLWYELPATTLSPLSFLIAAASQLLPRNPGLRIVVDFWLLALALIWAVVLCLAIHSNKSFPSHSTAMFITLFVIQILCLVLRAAIRLSRVSEERLSAHLPSQSLMTLKVSSSAAFTKLERSDDEAPLPSTTTKPPPQEHDSDSEAPYVKFSDYISLFYNRNFTLCWLGETSTNIGDWLNLVGFLTVIQEMYPTHNGVYTSFALFIRLVPSAAFVGFIGPLADRIDKRWGMIVCDILGGMCTFLLIFIKEPNQLWLLYLLVFLQNTSFALYDPLRRSFLPSLVSPRQLQAATTLDAIGYSTMAAVGASLGGYITSYYGTTACFLGDTATYALATLLFFLLDPTPYEERMRREAALLPTSAASSPATGVSSLTEPLLDGELPHSKINNNSSSTHDHIDSDEPRKPKSKQITTAVLMAHSAPLSPSISTFHAPPDAGSASLTEGLRFLGRKPHIIGYVLLKFSGGVIWGAADVMNVKISETMYMQATGDPSSTMGLLFGAMGFGCLLGPLLAGRVVRQTEKSSFTAALWALVLVVMGYMMNLVAPDIWVVIVGTVMRSSGTSILWVYSTLLIQLCVPPDFQGRVFAIEMGLYTIAEGASGMFGGVAYDHLNLNTFAISFIMCMTGTVVSLIWLAVFVIRQNKARAQVVDKETATVI